MSERESRAAAALSAVMREFPDVRESKPGGAYFVRSRSSEGAWWRVTEELEFSELVCTCPAGRAAPERLCWHGRRLYAYLRAYADAAKPPPAPFNPSAFVD